MIDVIDLLVILCAAGAAFIGVRQGFVKQVCVAVGVIAGLCITAFAYGSLAFLSNTSGVRSILSLILLLAVVLLCYSASLTVGSMLQKRWPAPKGIWQRRVNQISGGLIAGLTTITSLWMVAVMFGTAGPAGLQQQVAHSVLLNAVKTVAEAPPLFRSIEHALRPFTSPTAFVNAEPVFNSADTSVDQQFDDLDAAVSRSEASVLKINAWGCGSTAEGSGFMIGKRLVMTNAHIVAGAGRMSIDANGTTYTAQAVWFDPKLDAAVVLTDTDLPAGPLTLRTKAMTAGSIGAVIGYPAGGAIKVRDATVLQLLNATGYDIYGQSKTNRDIYAIRSTVQPGNSGGPLIDTDGKVAGLVFGNSTSQALTGYVIAATELLPVVQKLHSDQRVVSTGQCAG